MIVSNQGGYSTSSTGGFTSQPRKVVEKVVERKFDSDGRCVWEKVTESERWVYDATFWGQPYATWTTTT